MKKYLDPKADLTFKKVFGEHKDITISFLNAMLPLDAGDEVTEVEYMQPELVPDIPMHKDSIVDVRCKDSRGRQFIVEMQMVWTRSFEQRVLFNASKAYVRQLDRSHNYELLQPVYALSLVNDVFMPDVEDYYHPYHIVHDAHSDKVIDGLQLVFVELPKFRPHTITEKKMQVLWLRYLTEIDENTEHIPQELLDNAEVRKAIETVEESAYTRNQLLSYDKFWDIIRTEKTLVSGKFAEGLEKGMAEGLARGMEEGMRQGMKQGIEQGMKQGIKQGIEQGIEQGLVRGKEAGLAEGRAVGGLEKALSVAGKLRGMGMDDAQIMAITGLSPADMEAL